MGKSRTFDETPSQEEMSWLDDRLESFNAQQVGRDDFRGLNLVIRSAANEDTAMDVAATEEPPGQARKNPDHNIIAGLKATTGWDWLYIQILWVHEAHRGNGLGTQLLLHAEEESRRRGCTGSCLSSFDFQAPEFYERHGYTRFGQIEDYPSGHTMFFLSKRFGAS